MAENSKIPEGAMTLLTLIFFLGALFFTLLFAPFLPALLELYFPRDDKPLPISWNLVRDPMYFYKALGKRLRDNLPAAMPPMGRAQITLSGEERAELYRSFEAGEGESYPDLVFSFGSFKAGRQTVFLKDAYSAGDAAAGEGAYFRALAAEKDISLGGGTVIKRWIGAGGDITAGEDCDLGAGAACGGTLELSAGCRFRTLFAGEIKTSPHAAFPPEKMTQRIDLEKYGRILNRKMQDISLAAGMNIPVDVLARGQLRLGNETRCGKSIKTHSNLLVGHGSVIEGGLFSEGDIIIGMNCRIGGNIFSQGEVIIYPGTVVGRRGGIKSVIAKKSLLLSMNVKIYGQARTEGRGGVVL